MKLFKKIFRAEFIKANKLFLLVLCLWTIWVAYWSWVLPYNMGPDECLHFKTAQFFQTHQGFPIADKEPITFLREPECKGTTYISTPFVNYIVAAFFIKGGNLLGIERDYLAARMSSVFFGAIFVLFLYKFLEEFFKRNNFLIFTTLASTILIPQVTYIFAYLNHEAYSLACSSFLLFASYRFYRLSAKELKQIRYFLLLGLAISLQLFAKSNFYLLLLIPLVILALRFWETKRILWKNIITLIGLAFVLSGWFFVRNYSLYKDFLGVKTYQQITRSNLGGRTYVQAGWNLYDILFKSHWLEETASSFYGRFGYMTILIDPVMQWIFRFFVFLGVIGLVKKVSTIKKSSFSNQNIPIYLIFVALIPVNIAISLWNTLYFDFQNQGRYLFPILIPLMIMTNRGIFQLVKEEDSVKTLAIAIITGSILLNFWSFLYLPKI